MSNNGLHDKVDIVMATYNGAKYLRQQVNSILGQTYPHWHLLIGDDKSQDSTPQILDQIQKENPQKITAHLFKENLGVIENFSASWISLKLNM